MTHPLRDYIHASGDTLAAFAERVGVSGEALSRILQGEAPGPESARRIVDATGGAVTLAALHGVSESELADLSLRQRSDAGLDAALLAPVLRYVLKAIGADAALLSNDLVEAAAEAVANTHDALARVTTRRGADRLVQALRPVLGEIQKDFPELSIARDRLDEAAALAGDLYFQARPLLREP